MNAAPSRLLKEGVSACTGQGALVLWVLMISSVRTLNQAPSRQSSAPFRSFREMTTTTLMTKM